ncbi:MAG TPA: hypothetical protein VNP03_03070 [Pseudonocardia sp.]|nr:hypothetical protein [Pseudonocardia sp.]
MTAPLDGLLVVDLSRALAGPPPRFFDGDERERPGRRHTAPPVLDQHGPALRAELGIDHPVAGAVAAS